MYKLKEIKQALKILEQYDFQFSKASKATGIKVRTIRYWYNKQKEGKPLLTRPNVHTKKINGLFKKRKQSLITIFLKVKIVQLKWEFMTLIVNLKMQFLSALPFLQNYSAKYIH